MKQLLLSKTDQFVQSFFRLTKVIIALLLCVLISASSSFSQEAKDDEFFKKGIYLFRQENYDEALNVFKKSVEKYPNSSIAEYYLGLTYKRTENYISAKKHLEASLTLKPKIKGALIELIDLLYRLGDYDAAKKWIKVAEDEGIRPAQSKFLKGLTLQKTGEYGEAIEAFSEAQDLDDRLKQSAGYQIGVCHLKMKHFKDARDIFDDVFAIDPHSSLAERANDYIGAIDRKLESDRPFHFGVRAAFEYDSNVILKPTDSTIVSGVTEQEDTRMVYNVDGDYTIKTEDNKLRLKAGYGLQASKQHQFGAYDLVGNSFSLQGSASLGKALITFPVNYTHTVVNDKNYLSRISVGNVNNFMVGKSQMAQIGAIYAHDDYLRKSQVIGENRTGDEVTTSAGWFWFIAENKGFVNAKYSFTKDWTKGDNWKYSGHKVSGSVLYPFWEKFKLSLTGEVFLQNFDHVHSVYNQKREDVVYTGASLLSYEFMKNTEIQFRYTYVNDQSNINVFEYDRYVLSTGVQYRF